MCLLDYQPCHKPLKYRCPNKKSDHLKLTCLLNAFLQGKQITFHAINFFNVSCNQKEGIIVHECISHSSNIIALRGYFFSWLDTEISFENLEVMYSRSFEMNQQQTYKGLVLLLDGWEVCSYTLIPSLPCKQCSIVQPKNWIGLIVCRFLSINLSKSYSNSGSEYSQIHEIFPTMRVLYFCHNARKATDETDLLAPVEVDSHVYPHITSTHNTNYPN